MAIRWRAMGLGFSTDMFYEDLWDFALILGPLHIWLSLRHYEDDA